MTQLPQHNWHDMSDAQLARARREARLIWAVVRPRIKVIDKLTYLDVEKATGIPARMQGPALDYLWFAVLKPLGLPNVTALIVKSDTRMPSRNSRTWYGVLGTTCGHRVLFDDVQLWRNAIAQIAGYPDPSWDRGFELVEGVLPAVSQQDSQVA